MWPASYTRGIRRIFIGLTPAVVIAACNNPEDPEFQLEIMGYYINAGATGTDPATGEELGCYLNIQELDIPDRPTTSSLVGTWTVTTTIRLTRIRHSPTRIVTHDTVMAGQEVTLTIPDPTHVQLTTAGTLTENLTGDLDPNYPGWGLGDWSCGPDHPLAREQPGIVLTGTWRTQPIINYPID